MGNTSTPETTPLACAPEVEGIASEPAGDVRNRLALEGLSYAAQNNSLIKGQKEELPDNVKKYRRQTLVGVYKQVI